MKSNKRLSMYYKGWNVFGGSEIDLKDKCRKIDRGDTNGFIRRPSRQKLDGLEDFVKAIKEPIEDLAFSQDNPDFCKFGDPAGKIKTDAINSIVKAYKELIK